MNKYRLKFLLFLVFIIAFISILLWYEQRRDHPNYAPMFSGSGASMEAIVFAGNIPSPTVYFLLGSGLIQGKHDAQSEQTTGHITIDL